MARFAGIPSDSHQPIDESVVSLNLLLCSLESPNPGIYKIPGLFGRFD